MDFRANPAALDEADRKQLQRELKAAGFYAGTDDGVWGPMSRAAWRTAQAAKLSGPLLYTKTLDEAKRAEFTRLWQVATIRPENRAEVDADASMLLVGRDRYAAVSATTGVPWWIIGLLHGRECSYSFRQHLHNGDPLTARTVHVPAGRPKTGRAPFVWEYSAADALACDGFTSWTDWSLAGALHKMEAYNGFGYRVRALQSPYVWNMTTVGRPGKYVADGVFDPAAEDKQPGCAAILRALMERGAVKL